MSQWINLKIEDQIKVKHKILVCNVLAFTDGIYRTVCWDKG
jgi:hypothetical protein